MNHTHAKRKLVFATNNPHKLEEARAILGDVVDVVSLKEIDCHDELPETSDTLEGNAAQKAWYVYEKFGADCFADDTGLMVDALDGAPGVYTARYAGDHCSPDDNMTLLLANMEGKEQRDATFRAAICLIDGGKEHSFIGDVPGTIAHERLGDGGFGYDPVFVAKETGLAFAQMSPQAKNDISHRGRALRLMLQHLTH